ncbi:hypothetical protein Syun_014372 [Stephania yunnanensis]|uniref:Uncharacterized protein n=1 Tax=Stephania yunnanensis TaxID=152371 RepID=A0AAP0JJE6_9MAGN
MALDSAMYSDRIAEVGKRSVKERLNGSTDEGVVRARQINGKRVGGKSITLKRQLIIAMGERSTKCSGQCIAGDYLNELNMRIQSQEIEIEKLRLEHIKLVEENDGLHLEKQKLAEEVSYAKVFFCHYLPNLKNTSLCILWSLL